MDKQEGEGAINKYMEMLKESIYKEFLDDSGLAEESLGENDKKRLQALSAIAARHISILEESLANISAHRMNLKMCQKLMRFLKSHLNRKKVQMKNQMRKRKKL